VPVYHQTYAHYTGRYLPRNILWTLIAQSGLKHTWRKKGFRILLMISSVQFLIQSFRIYMAANSDLLKYLGFNNPHEFQDILAINDTFYYHFLNVQIFFCFLITLVAGADIISADRRTKALVLYLSKPLTRLDYLFGKGAVVLFYLYVVTLLQALLLMFLQAFFTDNWSYLTGNTQLILRIFAYANVIVLPFLLLILAFSSLSRSKIAAATMFCTVFMIPQPMTLILKNMLNNPMFRGLNEKDWWSLLSYQTICEQMGNAIFHQRLPYNLPWIWHAAVLAIVCILAAVVLYQQIRAVEVVN